MLSNLKKRGLDEISKLGEPCALEPIHAYLFHTNPIRTVKNGHCWKMIGLIIKVEKVVEDVDVLWMIKNKKSFNWRMLMQIIIEVNGIKIRKNNQKIRFENLKKCWK